MEFELPRFASVATLIDLSSVPGTRCIYVTHGGGDDDGDDNDNGKLSALAGLPELNGGPVTKVEISLRRVQSLWFQSVAAGSVQI